MPGFVKRLLTIGFGTRGVNPFVTPEKIGRLFEYGQIHGISGISLADTDATGLAQIINWQPDSRDWTIGVATKSFKIGDQIVIPPHIKWSNNPHFCYVGIVNNAIEFRSSDTGGSAWFLADETSEPKHVEQITALFKFWYLRLQVHQGGQQTSGYPGGLENVTRDSPIRGFKALSVIYPNHTTPQDTPFTARELSDLLSRSMDIEWFSHDPKFNHFSVSSRYRGIADEPDAYGFNFGPFDEETDKFLSRCVVVVRETAGGGFMVLISGDCSDYGPRIRDLFVKLPAQIFRLTGVSEEDKRIR